MHRTAALAVLAAALTLTACGAEEPASKPDAPTTTAEASTAATEPAAEASLDPTPSLPVDDSPLNAADGDDIEACYDGECEVAVTAPTIVPFDPDTGIESYTIEAIGEDYMVIGTHLGPVQSGIGTCSAVNDVAFALRSVTDGTAVVAFFPADSCEH
jgi:predicted small lipoprotein YifL